MFLFYLFYRNVLIGVSFEINLYVPLYRTLETGRYGLLHSADSASCFFVWFSGSAFPLVFNVTVLLNLLHDL